MTKYLTTITFTTTALGRLSEAVILTDGSFHVNHFTAEYRDNPNNRWRDELTAVITIDAEDREYFEDVAGVTLRPFSETPAVIGA